MPHRSLRRAAPAALAIAMLVPAAASAAETTTDRSCAGHWPTTAQGKPTMFAAGARAGDYLWHDRAGWHLRVTKVSSTTAIFTGRIHADRPMRVAGVALERGDTITLSTDRLTLTYRFANHGHVDGLDLTTDCATRLRISGSMNGALLPTSRIWIGSNGRHPLQNPFTITKVR